ncbi:MAG: hypothetical protein O3B68_19085, partial [Planctomycetota bacterium]|nr:hypothetical protein [Planctomycetota bacterium]
QTDHAEPLATHYRRYSAGIVAVIRRNDRTRLFVAEFPSSTAISLTNSDQKLPDQCFYGASAIACPEN